MSRRSAQYSQSRKTILIQSRTLVHSLPVRGERIMSKVKQWVDDCISKELKNTPFKPKGAVNIVVYDKTNVPPSGALTIGDRVKSLLDPHQSLTFWWKL